METVFEKRLAVHLDELKWLYCELYEGCMDMFEALVKQLSVRYHERDEDLKSLDESRLKEPDWYKKNDITGMMLYVDAFAGNLKGVERRLDYIQECQVNYLHLMPLLDSPKEKNDGGYAVSDFTKVKEELGTMEDLSHLAASCRRRGISVCLDFVMNHTSEEHEWARRARAGEKEYQDRYFFYDSYDIPARFEETCPQVFPTTAPGNFTWLPDMEKFVMTSFYPYQWDLNYQNPAVFHAMVDNLLNLTNHGVDIIRIDAVPYIWKELGTRCRNLPQVHSIVRMIRMICEIVCPGVLLLGEVVMEPERVVPYFGTVEKPECHMLYNVTTMATTWHTVATKDVGLLRRQMDIVCSLPKEYLFLNYLRCHDDIGWGLEYGWLRERGMDETAHKKFLNSYFRGNCFNSPSRGELYNDDPVSGDARLCGTTASLCGIESALESGTEEDLRTALACDKMLHCYMFTQSGLPVIYSGDEVGQLNDYGYKEDKRKADDSRYLHRGAFDWEKARERSEEGTWRQELFEGIRQMETIRREHKVFSGKACVQTVETWEPAILGLSRELDGERLIALFNFSPWEKTAWIKEEGEYKELLSGSKVAAVDVVMEPYGIRWLFDTRAEK